MSFCFNRAQDMPIVVVGPVRGILVSRDRAAASTRPQRQVRWRDDDDLVRTILFETDETVRGKRREEEVNLWLTDLTIHNLCLTRCFAQHET